MEDASFELPNTWEWVPLGKLMFLQNGFNTDKSAYGRGLRFANVMEVILRSHLVASDIPGRVSTSPAEANRYLVRNGDVLFNRTSETQEEVGLASVYVDDEPVLFGGFVLRGKLLGERLLPWFAGYGLRSGEIRRQIMASGQGGIRANVGQGSLSKIQIALPPKREQQTIAEALADADGVVEGLERLIAKKRRIKQGAMQDLLTAKRRLPGFSGEWETKTLGQCAQLFNGYAFKSETYDDLGAFKVITIAHVQSGAMNADHANKLSATPKDLQPHHHLGLGEILISMTGNVGRVCRVNENCCLQNQRVGKLVPYGTSNDFLFTLLSQKNFMEAMIENATGGAQGNIGKEDILGHTFRMPLEKLEQDAIAEVLSTMDAEITALETRLQKARQIKEGMMKNLLTGRIRLL